MLRASTLKVVIRWSVKVIRPQVCDLWTLSDIVVKADVGVGSMAAVVRRLRKTTLKLIILSSTLRNPLSNLQC